MMFTVCCLLIALITVICILLVQLLLSNLYVLLYGETGIYSAHLKKLYAQHKVYSGGRKWPATEAKEFINLALVSYTPRDQDKKRKRLLHGNVKEMLADKESIELDNIFRIRRNKLILMEGAPGIGKSTLAWELCRRWGENSYFMKRFSFVVLHRLRDSYTHKINSVRDLFNYDNEHIQQLVSDEVTASDGKGVLFILDGFDEFSHRASGESFLIKLITKQVLPESTVLVTTRPAATATFFHHDPSVDLHIEILGFTQDQVKKFTSDAFADKPEILENFLREASEKPVINSLMYVPLNAVIIIDMYKSNGQPIPKTQTQLYKKLCLTQIRRHLISNDPLHHINGSSDIDQVYKLDEIEDLSKYDNFYMHFLTLSRLAFDEFINENVIFYTLPSGLNHFGLIDKAPPRYSSGKTSYNFMHLTIQEFLVAYHIVHHAREQKCTFEQFGCNERWNLVWKFVSGLSKFEHFVHGSYIHKAFGDVHMKGNVYMDNFDVKAFLIACLFEAEVISDYDMEPTFMGIKVFHVQCCSNRFSPVDLYALGYFLVNTASTALWNVQFRSDISLEEFVRGLNSAKTCRINPILSLELDGVKKTYLNDFPRCVLHHLSYLQLVDSDLYSFSDAVLLMKNLKALYIQQYSSRQTSFWKINWFLHFVSKINLDFGFHNVSFALRKLFHPWTGSLKHLKWVGLLHDASIFDILFGPTSLETLIVTCCANNLSPSFALLSKNKNLKTLTLYMTTTPPLDSLMAVLEHNTVLEAFDLFLSELTADCGSLKLFIIEFLKLSKFESLQLWIRGAYPSMEKDYDELRMDPRFDVKFTFQDTPALHIRR